MPPTATVAPAATATPAQPALVDVGAQPTWTAPGATIVLSYSIFSPSAQAVSLGAGIRVSGTGCCWSYDPANDRTVNVPAGSSVVTRLFTLPAMTDVTYDVVWGLWSAEFSTQYDSMQRDTLVQVSGLPATATPTHTPTNTLTPTITPTPMNTIPPTMTLTPTQPVLLDSAAGPAMSLPGTLLVLTYTIFSPVSQQVSLGAGLRQHGVGGWFYDGADDLTLSVPAGTSVVSRVFAIPPAPTDVAYDVIWGLWSAGFGTQYGALERDNVVQVSGPPATATPTHTPTNTLTPTITPLPTHTLSPTITPTPTQPVLVAVAVDPTDPAPGSRLVLSFTVFSPVSQQVSLGAGLRQTGSGGWFYDGTNDRTLNVIAGTGVVTRSFTLPNTPNVSYDVIWGLWSAGFLTQYGAQERDGAVTVVGPTPTPSVPTLQDVAVAPATAFANGAVVLTYTVFSPVGQQVALGAAMAAAGSGQWVDDPARNLVVNINAGVTLVTRQFNLGTLPAGTYDVRWGVWNAGFTTEYADVIQPAALAIVSITATPTQPASPTLTGSPTPTATGTPPTATQSPVSTVTPNGTSLLGVRVSSGQANRGGSVTLFYTVYSPAGGPIVLAAEIRNASNAFSDPGGDLLVTVPAGTTVVQREFYISPVFAAGTYDVLWGLWDTCFLTQYAVQQQNAALVIGSATPAPTLIVLIPTPTATAVPASGAIRLGATGPVAGQQRNPGTSLTLSYTVNNNTGGPASLRLVANLAQTGFPGGALLTDTPNETTVSAPDGVSTRTRTFQVPATAGQGSYDLTWSLVDPVSNTVLDSRTAVGYLWVASQGQDRAGVAITSNTLTAPAITLQSGVVNRITGTLTLQNDAGVTVGVVLRIAIRRHGTTAWVKDLPGDALVDVPPGASTWTRGFVIPRYLPSGAYDVFFEAGTNDLSGGYDNNTVNSALQITNPAVIANVGVPILMYHNVNPEAPSGNWVTLCNFTAQMDYLQSNGYTTIDGGALYDYLYKGTTLPARPVWLTFDDSYQNISNYMVPAMQARGLQGSIFTVTQYMGQMNSWDLGNEAQHPHLTWDMLRAGVAAGATADSHTQHHAHMFDLSVAAQQAEIWGSQRDLVSFLGQPGRNFSYPYGQYPDSAKWLVAHSGFQAAVVINQVKQYTSFADLYELSRIGISDSDTLPTFISKLAAP
ncbi:MAG TPA: polysaccharide deacetylase family protein [Chloroflexia bacterium]|nr:polysaccharide deacetylase family protein [Chloroflexia bacterium]